MLSLDEVIVSCIIAFILGVMIGIYTIEDFFRDYYAELHEDDFITSSDILNNKGD